MRMLVGLLRHDVEIDVRRFRHKFLNCEKVQILLDSLQRGASEDRLGHSVLPDKSCGRDCDTRSLEMYDLRAELLCELNIGFESSGFRLRYGTVALYVQHEKLGVNGFGEPRAAGDEIAGGGVSADADSDLFGDSPMRSELFSFNVVIERAVDGPGDALQCHLAE